MRLSAWLGLFGLAGCVASASLVGGCSSSQPAGDKYPSVGDFCKARATAECQVANYCEIDMTTCTTVRTQDCLTQSTAAQAAGRTYTPGKAPDCVDATTSTYSSNTIKDPSTSIKALADTCNRVFVGTVQKNGVCNLDYDCASDRICDKGHCGDKTVVKNATDGCANPGEVCDTGLYCTGSPGSPAACTPKLAQNQPCSTSAPCVESLRCVSGACQARLSVGASCATDDDCATNFCDVFNPTGAKCGTQLTFSVGEPALCKLFSDASATVPAADAGTTPVADSAPPADAASE